MRPTFTIKRVTLRQKGVRYDAFTVRGYLHGERIRRQFKDREEALGEKNRLEVAAANGSLAIQTVITRLSSEQLAEAEACYRRLDGRSLAQVVDWYVENYRPPSVEKSLGEAIPAFLVVHADGVVERHHDEVRRQLSRMRNHFKVTYPVHAIDTAALGSYMTAQKWGPKTWNNVRGVFHSFFQFCMHDTRRWTQQNPAVAIPQREVRRGLPEIVTAEKLAELFAYLETFTGGARNPQPPGFIVPYFALATFAGIRPSARDIEIVKLARHPALARLASVKLGVVQILPEIFKTNDQR